MSSHKRQTWNVITYYYPITHDTVWFAIRTQNVMVCRTMVQFKSDHKRERGDAAHKFSSLKESYVVYSSKKKTANKKQATHDAHKTTARTNEHHSYHHCHGFGLPTDIFLTSSWLAATLCSPSYTLAKPKKRYEKLNECPWLFTSQCCVGWYILWGHSVRQPAVRPYKDKQTRKYSQS